MIEKKEKVEKCIRFKINAYDDRENMVVALANAGYKVWVSYEIHLPLNDRDWFVNVENMVKDAISNPPMSMPNE